MPVPFISCRNKVTGAEAEVPETALPHLTDWVPLGQPEPETDPGDADPDATLAPTGQNGEAAVGEPDADTAGPPPAPRTSKPRKAADTATTERN